MDGTARQGSGTDGRDGKHHLAKVRVAGSNPVFRSIQRGRSEAVFQWAWFRRRVRLRRRLGLAQGPIAALWQSKYRSLFHGKSVWERDTGILGLWTRSP